MNGGRFLFLAGFLLAVLSGCGTGPQSSSASTGPATATTASIGKVVTAADLQLTVTNVEAPFSSNDQFLKPKNGQFLVASVHLKNIGERDLPVGSVLTFQLRDSDGAAYNETTVPGAPKPPDGALPPGDQLDGGLTYDVPVGKRFELYFSSVKLTAPLIVDLGTY